MKKTMMMLSAMSAAAIAAPFNGFYAGGDLGLDAYKLEIDDQSPGYTGATKNFTGVDASVFGGYNHSFDQYLAGAELGLGLPFNSQENKAVNAAGRVTDTYKYQRGFSVNVAPRLGMKMGDSMAVYAKLGMGMRRDKLTHTVVSSGVSRSATKNVLSVMPGMGVEKAYGNVSVRGEYAYDFGKKLSVQDAASTNLVNMREKGHVLRAAVAYNF